MHWATTCHPMNNSNWFNREKETMNTQTTINFTASQLEELKRIVDTVGWGTYDAETRKIDAYVSDNRRQFAQELAHLLGRMDSAAIIGEQAK